MLVKFGDAEYDYEPSRIDVRTAITIREHTGMGMRSWEKAIDDADPLALQGLLWAMKIQAGERVTHPRQLNFSPVDFYTAVAAAAAEELTAKIEAEIAAGKSEEEATDPTETAE